MSSTGKKGLSQVALFILAVVVLIVVGVFYLETYKHSTTTSTSTKTTPSVAESSSCLKAYNDKALCAFAEHMKISTQQYIANGTATNSSGGVSNYTVKNDGKGNKEVVYTSSGNQITSITYGGTEYVQTGSGATWYKSPASTTTASVATNPTSGFTLNLSNGKTVGVTVTKAGTASCGKYSCDKYKVVTDSTPNATQYVYFDSSKYILREWTYNNPTSGISVDLTFNFQPVTIIKPTSAQ